MLEHAVENGRGGCYLLGSRKPTIRQQLRCLHERVGELQGTFR